MKKINLIITLSLLGIGAAWGAQPVSSPTPRPLRTVKVLAHSATHQFNVRLKRAVEKIQADMKAGKLTSAQAQDDLGKVKAIRVQELGDFKQSGTKELSQAQIDQLTQELNSLNL